MRGKRYKVTYRYTGYAVAIGLLSLAISPVWIILITNSWNALDLTGGLFVIIAFFFALPTIIIQLIAGAVFEARDEPLSAWVVWLVLVGPSLITCIGVGSLLDGALGILAIAAGEALYILGCVILCIVALKRTRVSTDQPQEAVTL